jgi:4-hydroxybutyryl-CoA dehydratase/vinylacetyl-CoA-Delta-isomerase
MSEADADYAVCCAVPVDAAGPDQVARPAGRPGEAGALFSNRYGQSTSVCLFDRVFVPWERVFLAGEWRLGAETHLCLRHPPPPHLHRRARRLRRPADRRRHADDRGQRPRPERAHGLREAMTELIKIVEGFYACGVAASVYATAEAGGIAMPEPVFANIGKLLLATQIYDMQRLAHEVSGGLIVTLPGPDEDHNPATAGRISEVLTARAPTSPTRSASPWRASSRT